MQDYSRDAVSSDGTAIGNEHHALSPEKREEEICTEADRERSCKCFKSR